jgi:hypothetical protein
VDVETNAAIERKGTGYAAVWDLDSISYVMKIFSRIRRATKDRNYWDAKLLSDSFNDKLIRLWNDQTVDDPEFEPIQVGMSRNKVVNDGLVRIAELVTASVGLNSGFGSSNGFFTHFAVGSGINAVSASDYQLQAEVARVGLASDGFQTAAGAVMRFGGFFGPSVPSCTINEAGVFDDPNSGTMLFRTVFPTGQGVTHTVNVDYVTISHSIFSYSV